MMYRNYKKYIPLAAIEVYWLFTYLLYRFGPIRWPFSKDKFTFMYVLACDLFFCMGYLLWGKIIKGKSKKEKIKYDLNTDILNKFLLICIVASALTVVPNSIRLSGNWYPQLITTLLNPGKTYIEVTQAISTTRRWNLFGFFDCFNFVVFPLIYFCWDHIKLNIKIFGCVISFYYLLIYCSSGRNMPCMLYVFSILITYISLVCTYGVNKWKKWLLNTFICFFSIVLMCVMFQLNLSSRTFYESSVEDELENILVGDLPGDNGKDEFYNQYKDLVITKEHANKCNQVSEVFPMYTNPYTKAYVDPEDYIYSQLPQGLKFIYAMGTQYVAGSYHALAVCLRMDFKWTYGIGFSNFLTDYWKRFTAIDVKSETYGARAVNLTKPPIVSTYGWETAYVQLAGDVTFAGVVILFFLIGLLTACVWNDLVVTNNAYALPFVIQLALFLVFVPMNCITFGSGGYFITFWFTMIIWLSSKKHWSRKHG